MPRARAMLRLLRSGGVGQFVVATIVGVIILVFVLEFRSGSRSSTGSLNETCAVRYEGYCVNGKEYAAAFGLLAPRGIDPKDVKRLELRQKTLDGLVERELLVEQAHKLHLGVSDEDLTKELESGRAHVSVPVVDLESMSRTLGLCPFEERWCAPGADRGLRGIRVRRSAGQNFDYKIYEKEVRNLTNRGPKEFREMQERELLAARMRRLVKSRVRVSEAEVEYLAQRGVIRSAQVSRSFFAKYALDQSDAAIDRWAFEHKDQVDAAWAEEKKEWAEGCPLIREIVTALPEIQVDDEKAPFKQKAEAARERVVKGEDLSTVAREVSIGDSAVYGGVVGCLSKSYGIGADELLKAVEGLKPGQLSGVIETPRGYHVVELLGKVDAANLDALGRRQTARELYARFASDEAAKAFAEKIVAQVKAGEKLEDVVRVLSDELVASRPGAPKPVPGAAKPADDASASALLLATDRPKFEVSASFNRTQNPLPDLEAKESIALKALELGKPEALYESPIETNLGWVVIQLKELSTAEELKTNKLEKRSQLQEAKEEDALNRYVANLRKTAGVKLVVDSSFGQEVKDNPEPQ